MTRKWGKQVIDTKKYWPTISTRICPEHKAALIKKHSNNGEISKLLRILVSKYLEGRIIGVRLEQ